MPKFSNQERTWLVQNYFKIYGKGRNGGPSPKYIRDEFEITFHRRPPTKRNLMKIIQKFNNTGTVSNNNKEHSGRRISSELNLSRNSVRHYGK